MKKYRHIALGVVLGIGLSFGFGAQAEVINMIGKTIDGAFPVKLDGRELENQAIVVEGTSYLPVRAIGEAIGYNVGFDADLGVSLTKTVTDSTYTDQPVEAPTKTELTPEQKAIKIQGIDRQIEKLNFDISSDQRFIDNASPSDPRNQTIEGYIQDKRNKIAELEKQKAELTK